MENENTTLCQNGYVESLNFSNTVSSTNAKELIYTISFYVPVCQGNPPTHFTVSSSYDKKLTIGNTELTITDKNSRTETKPVIIDRENNIIQTQLNYNDVALKTITITVNTTLNNISDIKDITIINAARLIGCLCEGGVFTLEKYANITFNNETKLTKTSSADKILLKNGELLDYIITFTIPDNYTDQKNIVLSDTIHEMLNVVSAKKIVDDTEIDILDSIKNKSLSLDIPFEDVKGKTVKVVISTAIEDVTKAPESNIISNRASLLTYRLSATDPDEITAEKEVSLLTTIPSSLTCSEAVSNLIESIALEETAIAGIIKAESEKILKIMSMATNIQEILQVNSSVEKVLANLALIEETLKNKLSIAITTCKEADAETPSTGSTTTPPTGATGSTPPTTAAPITSTKNN